jgi:general stress protein 26
MKETPSDLTAMQDLLDRSYAGGGAHLTSIMTPERRPTAEWLAAELAGMRLLVLATSTADGRPLAGPVDGILYRGAFHFSSSRDSVRARHMRARPAVSAVHLPAEELAVTVHGHAEAFDHRHRSQAGYRDTVLEVYVPRMGGDFVTFFDGPEIQCWRIEPEKMFAFTA